MMREEYDFSKGQKNPYIKKQKKQISALLLCIGLVVGLMSGCGIGTETVSGETTNYLAKISYCNLEYHYGSVEEYDRNGLQIKLTSYRSEELSGWSEYEYDAENTLIKKVSYESTGTLDEWSEYEYDADGNLSKETVKHANGFYAWRTYEYDAEGNLIKETEGVDDPPIFYEYEYDTKGNLTKESMQMVYEDTVISDYYVNENEYDDKGNLIKVTRYDNNQNLDSYNIYEYDVSGNQIRGTHCRADGSIATQSESEYDADGDLTKMITYGGEDHKTILSIYEMKKEYDAAGNLVAKTIYNDGKATESYEYEYATF